MNTIKGTQISRTRRITGVKNNKTGHPSRAQDTRRSSNDNEQGGLVELDPEKYGDKTSETEECETALLAEYAAMMGLFAGGLIALTSLAASKDLLPKKFKPLDLVLLGLATHKLSRIIAKDRITGAVRAPFVHHIRSSGEGEVEEEPRGRGMQRALGLLLSCPYCMGPWCAATLGFGMLFKPRVTKLFVSILSTVALSDFLHRGYALTKDE